MNETAREPAATHPALVARCALLRGAALCVILVGVLPGLAAAEAAEADYAQSGAYLGIGGSYAFRWVPGDFDRDLGGGAVVRADNTAGLNTRFGYRVNRWFSGELEYEWLDGFDVRIEGGLGGFSLSSHTLTANGKFQYSGWGRFQPWLLAGVGVSIYKALDRSGLASGLDSTSAGFAARFGFGIDTYLTENWLLNLGVEGVVNTTEIDNSIGDDLNQFFYIPIQLGLQYRF